MSSISRLFGRVAAALFYTTLLAANTAFGDERNPPQVLAREWAVQLPKASHQKVLLEAEQVMGTIKQNLDSEGIVLNGYDVVALFKEGKAFKGSSDLSASYQNATYLFTSAANRAEFEKDPAKYVPQYGGFCAYAITFGVLSEPETPDACLVYKGKLYVCGNQETLKAFKKDIDSNIEKANANWHQLASQ
jgi:YHS domain-containing protein